MTKPLDPNSDAPERRALKTTVRICPLDYQYHNGEDTDVIYYTNIFGRMSVQVRHLASARMSTWN